MGMKSVRFTAVVKKYMRGEVLNVLLCSAPSTRVCILQWLFSAKKCTEQQLRYGRYTGRPVLADTHS